MELTVIREALKAKGMTQRELAIKVGCSEPLVSHWIRGSVQPTLKFALKLESVLGVAAIDLINKEARA